MNKSLSISAAVVAVMLVPTVAEACAYHAMFANLTFGKFIIMLMDYFQQSAQAKMALAAEGLRTGEDFGPLFVALGFGFAYGSLHALGPGHGKVVISSYFLGRDGNLKEGVLMGAQIALVHVASAIIIVVAAHLLLSNMFAAEGGDYRPVRLVSYAAIAGIGIYMLQGAARKWWTHHQHAKAHAHHHDHDHDHDHSHEHESGCGCAAHVQAANGEGKTRSFVSLLVGVVPCTGAILVMLFAMANNFVFLGVLVVAAISVGMAATMASLGMVSVWLRRSVLERSSNGGAMALNLEMVGALLITSIGAVLFYATV